MAVDLHVSVTVTIQRSEHDAEGPGPMTKQHEQTVSQGLLREDGSPLVHWKRQATKIIFNSTDFVEIDGKRFEEEK